MPDSSPESSQALEALEAYCYGCKKFEVILVVYDSVESHMVARNPEGGPLILLKQVDGPEIVGIRHVECRFCGTDLEDDGCMIEDEEQLLRVIDRQKKEHGAHDATTEGLV
jgi:hypothetical protein